MVTLMCTRRANGSRLCWIGLKTPNLWVEPFSRHFRANYTSLGTTHRLPVSSGQPRVELVQISARWNGTRPQNWKQLICPKPVIVVVQVNGQSCCALFDSGSLAIISKQTWWGKLKKQWWAHESTCRRLALNPAFDFFCASF